jgi:dUTPase
MSDWNPPTYRFALREGLKDEKIFLPRKGEPLATGWDVRAAFKFPTGETDREPLKLRPGQFFKIPLGFRVFCPPGWWYSLHPRSSSFIKKSMHCLIGVIDETYPDELVFAGQYIPDVSSLGNDLVINFGDAIGQIIPVRRQEMVIEEISNETMEQMLVNRNAVRQGGIGSTDKK